MALKSKIEKFNARTDLALLAGTGAGQSPSTMVTVTGSHTPGAQPRVVCRPVFGASEVPVNPASAALLADAMTTGDFEAKVELRG